MGGFEINKNITTRGIEKEVLKNTEQCKKMDENDFNSLWSRFDADGSGTLDEREQVEMFAYLESIAGNDDEISRKDVRKARKNSDIETDNNLKYRDYKHFSKGAREFQTPNNGNPRIDGSSNNEYIVNNTTYTIDKGHANQAVKNEDGTSTTTLYDNKGHKTKETVDTGKGNTTVTEYYPITGPITKETKKKETKTTVQDGIKTVVESDFGADGKATKVQTKEYKTVGENEQLQKYETKEGGNTVTRAYTYNEDGSPKEMTVTTNDKDGKEVTKKYTKWGENGIEDTTSEVKEQPKPQINKDNRPKKTTNSRIRIPQEWKGNRLNTETIDELQLDEHEKADEIFDIMIKHFKLEDDYQKMSDRDKENLKKDFIKYNPSMFNKDGTIHNKANWSRLDFPAGALDKYKGGAKPIVPKAKPKATPKTRTQAQAGAGKKAGTQAQSKETTVAKQAAVQTIQERPKPTKEEQNKIDAWNKEHENMKIQVNSYSDRYELSTRVKVEGDNRIWTVTGKTFDELQTNVKKRINEEKRQNNSSWRTASQYQYRNATTYASIGRTMNTRTL